MPYFVKMDIYRVVEKRDNAVYKTKKFGYHWFLCGKCPEPYEFLSQELIKQNQFPEGEYYYASTLDSIVDSRIPRGGMY